MRLTLVLMTRGYTVPEFIVINLDSELIMYSVSKCNSFSSSTFKKLPEMPKLSYLHYMKKIHISKILRGKLKSNS